MRPPVERSRVAAIAIVVTGLLAACAGGAPSPDASTLAPSPPAPSPTLSPSPSAAVLPATLIGTWSGIEEDPYWGETWSTTYRLEPCRQHIEPWKPLTDDQQCGSWMGRATIQGLPAECTGTLSWIGSFDGTFVFLASGPATGKYRTIPHPYLDIDGRWYCWNSFRLRLTPGEPDTLAVETIGAGSQSGEFNATTGSLRRDGP